MRVYAIEAAVLWVPIPQYSCSSAVLKSATARQASTAATSSENESCQSGIACAEPAATSDDPWMHPVRALLNASFIRYISAMKMRAAVSRPGELHPVLVMSARKAHEIATASRKRSPAKLVRTRLQWRTAGSVVAGGNRGGGGVYSIQVNMCAARAAC